MTVLTLSDGATIAARISGTGKPIVFVHGWSMNGDAFDGQRAALESSGQVITFDLRGHRRSTTGRTQPTIERLGDDLIEIFEQLSLEGAVCAGWSMGAMVAWQAMADPCFQKRIAGLVVIDMSPRISNDSTWSLGLSDGRRPLETVRSAEGMRADWRAMVRQFVPRIFAEGSEGKHAALIARLIEEASALDAETMASLWESIAVQDFRKEMADIGAPMLIAHGAKSQLYPGETADFIARAAPNARIVRFENSGHAPHLEETERFNAELKTFINVVNASPARSALLRTAAK